MSTYDFKQLSFLDFEKLSRDLLQERDGFQLEGFKSGPDQGADFRYARTVADNVIVQCKHYVGSGIDSLWGALRKERPKARKLKPSRYILTTSVDLPKAEKDKIAAYFGSMLSPHDILGQSELNNLLGQHPEVETRHFKLWLSSTAVLQRVLHNAEAGRSAFEVRRVHRNIPRYVHGQAYPDALRVLQQRQLVILSGPPGVGKTTHAELLLYNHLNEDWSAVVIGQSFEDAEKLFLPDGKQIFYFDDFLGVTFLGDGRPALGPHQDRALLGFIERVRETPDKRLILTTRAHILAQAKRASEKLGKSHLIDDGLVIDVKDYDRSQKAEIVYNHLHFGAMPRAYVDQVLADRFYLEVIDHPKFMPRLIEWITRPSIVEKFVSSPDGYCAWIRAFLDDPSEIWKDAYDLEINEAARSLLLALFTLSGSAALGRLSEAFVTLHEGRAKRYGFVTRPDDLQQALRALDGSFLAAGAGSGQSVKFFDPSLGDLMTSVVRQAPQNAVDVLRHFTAYDQVARLWRLAIDEPDGALMTTLRQQADALVPDTLRALRLRRRGASSGFSFSDEALEERLHLLLQIVGATGSAAHRAQIAAFVAEVIAGWTDEDPDFGAAVEALLAWRHAETPGLSAMPEHARFRQAVLDIACAEDDLSPRDAAELARAFTPVELDPNTRARLAQNLRFWTSNCFADHLDQTNSTGEYEGLIEDLAAAQSLLGVNLAPQIDATQTRLDEHEHFADQYADLYADEWRDARSDELDDRDIDDMFGSLADGPDEP